jgi:hypothetical protein
MVVPRPGRRKPAYPQQAERTWATEDAALGTTQRVKDGTVDVSPGAPGRLGIRLDFRTSHRPADVVSSVL